MSEYEAIRDVFQDQMDTPEYKQLFYTAVLDAAQPVFNDAMTARAEAEQLRAQNAALIAAIEAAFAEGWDCGSNENIQTFAAAWEHSKAKALTEAQK